MTPKLIVHGGAWDIPDRYTENHIKGVKAAVDQIYPLLQEGGSALDAVEQAVNILEADPTFDAGRGAFLNARGEIELDALIMDGKALDFGSVAAVSNLLHPVSLARKVMNAEDFRFLVGDGAMEFARKWGFEILNPKDLLTERELKFYESIRHDTDFSIHKAFSGSAPSDTVGAVALDQDGNLACATSTGGTPRKHAGRVGDSPIVGAGGYADNLVGAASSTGYGESLLRVMFCKTACDAMAEKGSAPGGAVKAIEILEQRVNGHGGIIMISPQGEYGFAHNTPRMAFAYADDKGDTQAAIKVQTL